MELGPSAATVLIVDDDPGIRALLVASLELNGYATIEADSGAEGISKAKFHLPDAILLDVVLKDMEGYDVCKALREVPELANAVIILLTVLNSPDDVVKGFRAGADDFIFKPFQNDELLERLHARLKRMRLQSDKENMLERFAGKLAQLNKRLQEEASADSLTGLYNRRYFWKRFEEEFQRAKRYGHDLSFILLDVDHFKDINDTHGHPVGDAALKAVADILRKGVRGIDFTARYGGEEFAVLLPETGVENAKIVAERVRLSCGQLDLPPIPMGGLCLSAGVATFPVHAETPQDLYIKADQALYAAKSSGRNRVVVA